MSGKDDIFLRQAISLARKAREEGQEPFGAILVKDDKILAEGKNQIYTLSDPTAHAESWLIHTYCQKNKIMNLNGYTMYASTEPCIMCTGAIYWAKISRVVFSVSQDQLHQISKGSKKPDSKALVKSDYGFEFIGPTLTEEGLAVFKGYQFLKKA